MTKDMLQKRAEDVAYFARDLEGFTDVNLTVAHFKEIVDLVAEQAALIGRYTSLHSMETAPKDRSILVLVPKYDDIRTVRWVPEVNKWRENSRYHGEYVEPSFWYEICVE